MFEVVSYLISVHGLGHNSFLWLGLVISRFIMQEYSISVTHCGMVVKFPLSLKVVYHEIGHSLFLQFDQNMRTDCDLLYVV